MKKVPLGNRRFALVDNEDFASVSKFKWYAWGHRNTFYAARGARKSDGTRTIILMHRAILKCRKGQQVDHCDRNGLNNRRENLRFATDTGNRCNSKRRIDNRSGFKGVSLFKPNGKFRARIKFGGVEHSLGYFDTPEKAHAAYKVAAVEHHGNFARFE